MKRLPLIASLGALLGFLALHPTSRASIFGEENVTLGAILTESIRSYNELHTITDTLADSVEIATDLVDAYERVNAGIDELSSYSVNAFLSDFKGDLYHLYPGLERIEGGSQRLRRWEGTHTESPFTAYAALGAVAGDLTGPFREDLRQGRRSLDREIILQREAAGGFALAGVAEASTRTYDREIERLRRRYERDADPGTAAMVSAHATLLFAEEQSHVMRLLSRVVRLDAVQKTVEAGERLAALGEGARREEETALFASAARKPPRMMRFTGVAW